MRYVSAVLVCLFLAGSCLADTSSPAQPPAYVRMLRFGIRLVRTTAPGDLLGSLPQPFILGHAPGEVAPPCPSWAPHDSTLYPAEVVAVNQEVDMEALHRQLEDAQARLVWEPTVSARQCAGAGIQLAAPGTPNSGFAADLMGHLEANEEVTIRAYLQEPVIGKPGETRRGAVQWRAKLGKAVALGFVPADVWSVPGEGYVWLVSVQEVDEVLSVEAR